MREFFAALYEWFGLNPFFSADLSEHLKGYDITCSNYTGTPLYVSVGVSMILITIICYSLQYYAINSTSFNKRIHWWIVALVIIGVNFFIAFVFPYKDLKTGDYCSQLNLSFADCFGFGISNALLGFVLFLLLTSFPFPRKLAGYNTTETTFWKPKS